MNLSPKFDLARMGLSRRSFLRRSGLITAMTPFAAMLLGAAPDANAAYKPPVEAGTELDIAILNFALNLEFLEANYYTYGVTGESITAQGVDISGSTSPGLVTIKPNPQVPFDSPVLAGFASEIASDEIAHIKFIQNTIAALGGTPISQPNIDLLNSFHNIGAVTGIDGNLDPFENETNFFLGGFSLTDVGVTAYHGAAPLITNKAVLSGASGILAAESYHDSVLRLMVYSAGTTAQTKAQKISDLRHMLGDPKSGTVRLDQGVAVDSATDPTVQGTTVNIVPTDSNSIVFARNPHQVLNIVYGNRGAATGGFFPTGVNGIIN